YRAAGQAEQAHATLDVDHALGLEDAGVQRQQLPGQAQRLVGAALLVGEDQLLGLRSAEVGGRADDADRADGELGEQHRVAAAVEREVAALGDPHRGDRVVLGVLDADDARVLGQPDQGVGLDGYAGAVRYVVEQHGYVDRVGDRGEVHDQPGLRRLVVIGRHH